MDFEFPELLMIQLLQRTITSDEIYLKYTTKK